LPSHAHTWDWVNLPSILAGTQNQQKLIHSRLLVPRPDESYGTSEADRITSMHYFYDTVRIDLSTRRTENILADLRSVFRALLVRTIPGGLGFYSRDFQSPGLKLTPMQALRPYPVSRLCVIPVTISQGINSLASVYLNQIKAEPLKTVKA
jgi:hypothetical protein